MRYWPLFVIHITRYSSPSVRKRGKCNVIISESYHIRCSLETKGFFLGQKVTASAPFYTSTEILMSWCIPIFIHNPFLSLLLLLHVYEGASCKHCSWSFPFHHQKGPVFFEQVSVCFVTVEGFWAKEGKSEQWHEHHYISNHLRTYTHTADLPHWFCVSRWIFICLQL